MNERPRIVLGTMRFNDVDRSEAEWIDHLVGAWELGVRTLHSSLEYETFDLVSRLMAKLGTERPEIQFRHMAKVAEPSFSESGFDATRLTDRVRQYCDGLGTTRLDDVQWMWRADLDNDDGRIDDFVRESEAIAQAAHDLRSVGLIDRFLCFPYSARFATTAVHLHGIDGLVVYRNVNETEYDQAIGDAALVGKPSIVIRPLHAGAALASGRTPAELVSFALDQPGVESAVVSTNHLPHLRELLTAGTPR